MAYGLLPTQNLPHGLDVWQNPGGKVLNIEWSDTGEVAMISFKRGEWETRLEKIAVSFGVNNYPNRNGSDEL